ncbi:uncharacterized protein LOC111022420 [Momordica charantia]|uniref:Uncharacterized protein LOC111022420 n=1 Tax=Momordica charantia TaxID=3673 RepID=A0A6J1DPT8_MOMCH|nr:uncharacterized protein LOC111022420 [Momordica charantia]
MESCNANCTFSKKQGRIYHRTIDKPKDNMLSAWKCNNDVIILWIMNSVSRDIAASLVYSDSASDIWNELRDRFQQSNGPRIYQLRKEFVTIEAYYTKLKTVWQELSEYHLSNACTCGGLKQVLNHFNSEYVMMFLMGLNESYAGVRAQILFMDPMPPINKVFSLLIQEENHRSVRNMIFSPDSIALAAKEVSKRPQNDRFRKKEFQRPFCTHCGIKGHIIECCYKLHGYPPRYRQRSPTPTSSNSISTSPALSSADKQIPS